MLSLAVLVVAFALINRARGGGLYAEHLPGHPRFYAAPIAMFVSAPFVGPIDAVLVGVSFLFWSLLPWGAWYDLGRLPRDFPATWFEESIERLPNDHVRFTARNIIALIPGAILLGWPLLLLAPAQTVVYEIGWRRTPQTPTVTGEWLTGAMWGVFVWFLA